MKKARPAIPRAIKDSVLNEFNHRCAICGKERPQVHHIDENPSNNESSNLIPLCPSCHLTDLHNPTTPIDAEKLRLFRHFKDPIILKPQFHPLFMRMQFLNPLDENLDTKKISELVEELIEFVDALEMGSFYSKRISNLLGRNFTTRQEVWPGENGPIFLPVLIESEEQYLQRINDKYPTVAALVVELLRFQKW